MTLYWRETAYAGMTFNSPLSEERAADLVATIADARPTSVLDLGCGWGELLVRVAVATPTSRAVGVDSDPTLLQRAAKRAAAVGVADRVECAEMDVTAWDEPADVVLLSGVSHAFGGLDPMLRRARVLTRSGGSVVIGEGVHVAEMTATATKILGKLPSVTDVLAAVERAGFTVESSDLATAEEWDDFESAFRSQLEVSEDPELRAFADLRRREYLDGYRGVAGFLWVVAGA